MRLNATTRCRQRVAGLRRRYGGTVLFVPESSTDAFTALWDRGVCDGLEIAAHLVESAMEPLDRPSESRHVLLAVLTVLREAQLGLQLDPT